MEASQQITYCKKCDKRKFDISLGLNCTLTSRKPGFLDLCKEFVLDPREANITKARAAESISEPRISNKSIWIYIGITLVIIKASIALFRYYF